MALGWARYQFLLHSEKWYCMRRLRRVQYHFSECNKNWYCAKPKCHICFIICLLLIQIKYLTNLKNYAPQYQFCKVVMWPWSDQSQQRMSSRHIIILVTPCWKVRSGLISNRSHSGCSFDQMVTVWSISARYITQMYNRRIKEGIG